MRKIRISLLLFCLIFISQNLFAQEALKSTEEDYYDFLSLTGIVERPVLGYRTLSDSVWNFSEDSADHIWKDNNLGTTYTLWQASQPADNFFARGLKQGLTARIYGPEWYNSYNTSAPYGQNDGALWQGRGYNTSLTTGLRLEGYGFELTFKPMVGWMQNGEFEYNKPNYNGPDYEEKAKNYGYYGVCYVDAPQRFGNENFWFYDWGDTEVRYTLHNFTLGFGTQAIWLGPAQFNPIIHSNNATSYPKIDIGLRKTTLTMPHFGWNLGELEFRGWWGYLSESQYFDNIPDNDHNLISGLSVYYQLPFLKDFTVGLNRIMLSKWNDKTFYTLFRIYNLGLDSGYSGGGDESDQRISISFDYLLKPVGLELYLEWAKNDFSPNLDSYIRYPYHTQGWTFGGRKSFNLQFGLKGELKVELTSLECSADYLLFDRACTFYAHHIITQGYTNGGQWLGAGIGTGGNSQYLGFTTYFNSGSITLFGQRRNPDLDYTMFYAANNQADEFGAERSIYCIVDLGLEGSFYPVENLLLKGKFVFDDHHNPIYYPDRSELDSRHRYNFVFSLFAKYIF